MSLVDHVAHLKTLAALDPESSLLDTAIINVIEEMAGAVDRLKAEHPSPPDTERGFGSI